MNCYDKLANIICYKQPGEDAIGDDDVVCEEGQRYYQG